MLRTMETRKITSAFVREKLFKVTGVCFPLTLLTLCELITMCAEEKWNNGD